MKNFVITAIAIMSATAPMCALTQSRQLLDSGWRFSMNADSSVVASDFDDSNWRRVDLPHDWSVELDFDRDCPSGNDGGYLPTGTGWYRRTIHVGADAAPVQHLYLEGAYMNSEVWVNGHRAGGHPYGYTSYRVDITPFLNPGDNTVAIKVDNSHQKNSRWYSGSGIYRHVWLERHPDVYVEPWSMRITTPVVSPEEAVARVQFTLACPADRDGDLKMPLHISGARAGIALDDTVLIRKGEREKYLSYDFRIPSPSLWSPESPELYSVDVKLGNGDTEVENFGIRTFSWSPDGFELNGDTIVLSGACVHHDNGILGAASHDAAEYRKAALLKDAGFNAVRTSHNPPAPAFLDACDRLGLLVIDEAFDGWR